MRNKLVILAVAVLIFGAWRMGRAQSDTAATFQGLGPHTTCRTPATGAYYWCAASDGIWVSNNGAAYFQIVAPAVVGVSSVIVCNAAGGACGTAQTGPVVTLNIPTKVTVSVPTVTSVAAVPVVTSTATAPSATLQ